MANKFDEHAEPVCGECGRRMAHYTTLPKVHDRPSVIVFKCDHCGATIIKSKEVEALGTFVIRYAGRPLDSSPVIGLLYVYYPINGLQNLLR